MSNNYRFAWLLAFGLLLGAGQPQAPESRNGATAGRPDPRPFVPPVIRTISIDKPDGGCLPQLDDRRSDLCAQWKAADAATQSALWSWWQMVLGAGIGGLTLVAAVVAAWFAREAAKEAHRTADTADKALQNEKDNHDALNRPWITIDAEVAGGVQWGLPPHGDTRNSMYFGIKLTFTNVGNRPARDVRYEQTCVVFDGSSSRVPEALAVLRSRNNGPDLGGNIIMHGDKTHINKNSDTVFLRPNEIEKLVLPWSKYKFMVQVVLRATYSLIDKTQRFETVKVFLVYVKPNDFCVERNEILTDMIISDYSHMTEMM